MADTDGGTILVLGGYGAVGATITGALGARFGRRVLCAGRNVVTARETAAAAGARAVRLDLAERDAVVHALDQYRVTAVVLAVEPPDAGLARTCLERGVHVVDVGASPELLAGVERLGPLAERRAATAVLSVGLAPGLTNVLARRAHDELGGADRVDLTVLLGAGERHGADAVRWTLAGLAAPRGTARRARVALPGYGRRTAHPFPFSDQHTLRRTLGVAGVTTRLCLDSATLTAVLFGLRSTGLARVTRRPRVLRAFTGALTRVHVGGDGFAVRAEAVRGPWHATYAVTGHTQSRITGLVAARVTEQLLTGRLPAGVHHLDQLPAFADLPERLAPHDVRLWHHCPA